MVMNVVENVNGRAKVSWPGAAVLFLALVASCALVPAAGLWLALGDAKLAATAVAIGFSIACCSFPLLLGQQRGLPLDRLPTRAGPGTVGDVSER
jgi:hypothetical protein